MGLEAGHSETLRPQPGKLHAEHAPLKEGLNIQMSERCASEGLEVFRSREFQEDEGLGMTGLGCRVCGLGAQGIRFTLSRCQVRIWLKIYGLGL